MGHLHETSLNFSVILRVILICCFALLNILICHLFNYRSVFTIRTLLRNTTHARFKRWRQKQEAQQILYLNIKSLMSNYTPSHFISHCEFVCLDKVILACSHILLWLNIQQLILRLFLLLYKIYIFFTFLLIFIEFLPPHFSPTLLTENLSFLSRTVKR